MAGPFLLSSTLFCEALTEFLPLSLEYVCIFVWTYEHPLYRFIFLHRGRFVYCPFLLVRFNKLGAFPNSRLYCLIVFCQTAIIHFLQKSLFCWHTFCHSEPRKQVSPSSCRFHALCLPEKVHCLQVVFESQTRSYYAMYVQLWKQQPWMFF